jgi:hypothetical protein
VGRDGNIADWLADALGVGLVMLSLHCSMQGRARRAVIRVAHKILGKV